MADQNQQQPENASTVDKTVDNALNSGIDAAANRVPGGQKLDQTAKDKADQAANSAVNNELSKGVGGMEKDAKGLFGKNQ